MTPRVELSVVIPSRNSGTLVEESVRILADRLTGQHAELIIVENGSTDDTFERCTQLAERWDNPTVSLSVLRSRPGMGNALRVGALASVGVLVLLTADDLPFGTDDIDGAERRRVARGITPTRVIVGSKTHPASIVDRGPLRNFLTRSFALLRRAVLGMRTGDPQGTFIIEGDLLRALAPDIAEPGFLFTTELTYVVELLGIHPVEVPVALRASHHAHRSRVSLTDAVWMALGLPRLRRRHRGKWGSARAAKQ